MKFEYPTGSTPLDPDEINSKELYNFKLTTHRRILVLKATIILVNYTQEIRFAILLDLILQHNIALGLRHLPR